MNGVTWLMLAGWLHGVASRVGMAWHGGGTELTAVVSPIEFLVVWIAATAMNRLAVAPPPILVGLGFALALLVPSSLCGYGAMIGLSGWVALGARGSARTGALLFAGLGACGLWGVLGARLAGEVPLRWDAACVEFLLSYLHQDVVRVGNVVGVAGGHRIVVLFGCATISLLPPMLLTFAAAASYGRQTAHHRLLRIGALLAATVTANLARMTLLALSPDAYRLGHGAVGQMAFDAVITLLPLALGHSTRPTTPAMREPAAPARLQGGAMRGAILSMIAFTGVGMALLAHDTAPLASREARTELALAAFLAQTGWLPAGELRLTGDGSTMLRRFAKPGCGATLAVTVTPHAAEVSDIVRLATGADMAWLDRGRLFTDPPLAGHAWSALRDAALSRLGGTPDRAMPLIAIAPMPHAQSQDAPDACRLPSVEMWRGFAGLR